MVRAAAVGLLCASLTAIALAQQRGNPNPLRMITKTIYTPRTEFFAVYRPYVVGQEGRLTAHMSRITDRFEAYPENSQLTFTLTVGGAKVEKSKPDVIERSGHFAFTFTPTVAGTGTVTVVLTTPERTERFVVDNIVVESDLQTAIAHQGAAPPPDGSIRYSKEAGWDGRFLTTPVTKTALVTGKTAALAVPKAAIVQVDGQPHVYVQRDPEAFYLRPVKTGESNDRYVAVAEGVREGDRVVTVGVEKMPRK
jgi:multidrug efflux pump subunit AcrA (membrane-fusion protein)